MTKSVRSGSSEFRASADKHDCQREGGVLAAAVICAIGIEAQLRTLGGIDGIEADPCAMDINRVAIDNACSAHDRRGALPIRHTGKKTGCQGNRCRKDRHAVSVHAKHYHVCTEFGTCREITRIFDAASPWETAASPAPLSASPAAAQPVWPPRSPAPAASCEAPG